MPHSGRTTVRQRAALWGIARRVPLGCRSATQADPRRRLALIKLTVASLVVCGLSSCGGGADGTAAGSSRPEPKDLTLLELLQRIAATILDPDPSLPLLYWGNRDIFEILARAKDARRASTVSALLDLARTSPEVGVRSWAALLSGNVGDFSETLAVLRALLADTKIGTTVQGFAYWGLVELFRRQTANLDGQITTFAPVVLYLTDPDHYVQEAAITSLHLRLTSTNRPTFDADGAIYRQLVQILENGNAALTTRALVAAVLLQMVRADDDAAPYTRMVSDPFAAVRGYSAASVGKILRRGDGLDDPRDPQMVADAVNALRVALERPNEIDFARFAIVDALGLIADPVAFPSLLDHLRRNLADGVPITASLQVLLRKLILAAAGVLQRQALTAPENRELLTEVRKLLVYDQNNPLPGTSYFPPKYSDVLLRSDAVVVLGSRGFGDAESKLSLEFVAAHDPEENIRTAAANALRNF